jgi:hypothetical protein
VIRPHDLISEDYRDAQIQMHRNPRGYGGRGDHWAATVVEVAKRYDVQSILDYGAGQGRLGIALRKAGFVARDYDPAIPGWDGRPSFSDMVNCTDVLEHVEPRKLDTVLKHIRILARKVVFIVVATRPANKRLPNGDNAHLIIENENWWQKRILSAGFTLQDPPSVMPQKMPGKCWYGVLTP